MGRGVWSLLGLVCLVCAKREVTNRGQDRAVGLVRTGTDRGLGRTGTGTN